MPAKASTTLDPQLHIRVQYCHLAAPLILISELQTYTYHQPASLPSPRRIFSLHRKHKHPDRWKEDWAEKTEVMIFS